ncbi:MAG: molybdate ABC transporter substrate-binding protein [Nannocystaceae bacterium]|nr:molybdate ABC transporter substrate-binding protein [Nannocystaceae bacterium]
MQPTGSTRRTMLRRTAAAVLLGGCGRGRGDALQVLEAAGLTDVLPRIAADAGLTPSFHFDASSRLAQQIDAGVPADVFISADAPWMDALEGGGRIDPASRVVIARNRLVVIVPATATRRPTALAELAAVPRLALAGAQVPAGRYADAALQAAGVAASVAPHVVRGQDVRTALAWVRQGEAHAGIVYATDAFGDDGVAIAFAIDPALHPAIVYPAAVVRDAAHPAAAAALLAACRSEAGVAALRDAGFEVDDHAGP